MREVRVVYRKYDGSLHWNYTARHLGEDEYGIWLGAPDDTTMSRGTDHVTVCPAHVLLCPRDAWWTGSFNAEPHKTEIYCDITTVPRWPTPHEVTMIDLDLDVLRRRTGLVEIDDEDEFALHQIRYGYPAEVVTNAQAAADWLASAVEGRVEPFGSAYKRWLELVE